MLGTGNYSPKLTILTALQFYNKVGGPEKVMKYCHDLAWEAGKTLTIKLARVSSN